MAQSTPAQLGSRRIPMMSASMLDARTRPFDQEPTPIWLQHRMQRRRTTDSGAAPRRAREWVDRLAGRTGD